MSQAFDLIDVLLTAREGLTLSQLVQCIDPSKNKMFRLLSTLKRRGIVEKDRDNRYRLGAMVFGTARRVLASWSVLDQARPVMEELARIFNEAVYLATFQEGSVLFRDMADCRQPIKAASFVGRAFAFKPGNGAGTIARGVSVDSGGMDKEITTVSALFGSDSDPITGALVVLAPTFRISLEKIETDIAPILSDAAQRLSLLLGAPSGCRKEPPRRYQEPEYTGRLSPLIIMQPGNYRQNDRHYQQ